MVEVDVKLMMEALLLKIGSCGLDTTSESVMSLFPDTAVKEGKVVDVDGISFVIMVSFELGMAVVDGTETRIGVETIVDDVADISVVYVEFSSALDDTSNAVVC